MNLEERFNFRVSPSDGWYALVDCNNFYCSCERVYNPSLKERPIVVLSNNDGCIIARSNEAKLLGIGMGDPYFKMKSILQKHKINGDLYSSSFKFDLKELARA